jgi:hypothetical protein
MRTTSTLLFLGLVAAAHGGLFVQDGQEYEYMTTISSAAGTMDVATHSSGEQYKMKVRLQVAGTKLNVKISDIKHSIFVGGHLPTDDQYAGTKFEPVEGVESLFSVQLDSNGLFQSVDVPAGFSIWQKKFGQGLG